MAQTLRSESSLRLKEATLRREAAWLRRIHWTEAILTGALLLGGAILWGAHGQSALLWTGAAVLFLTIGHRLKQRENETEADHLEVGGSGEREVARLLAEGLPDDTLILNDLILAQGRHTAQIDHLVLSPRGAFVVETKTWSGRLTGRVDGATWSVQGRHGKPHEFKNPVRQNRRQARFLRDLLRSEGLDTVDVVPLVVLAAPRCELAVDGGTEGVVFRAPEVVRFVRGYSPRHGYSNSELARVLRRLGVHPEATPSGPPSHSAALP